LLIAQKDQLMLWIVHLVNKQIRIKMIFLKVGLTMELLLLYFMTKF